MVSDDKEKIEDEVETVTPDEEETADDTTDETSPDEEEGATDDVYADDSVTG